MRKDEPKPMSAAEHRNSERPQATEDPVASLFSADRTLPAPVVAPEVNESELTRWKSARDSLFGDLVKDPPPPAGAASGSNEKAGLGESDPRAVERSQPRAQAKPERDSGTPLVRALSVSKIGAVHEGGRDYSEPEPLRAEDLPDLAPPPPARQAAPPRTKQRHQTKLNAAPPPAAGAHPPDAPPEDGPFLLGDTPSHAEPRRAKRAEAGAPGSTAAQRTRKKTPPMREAPPAPAPREPAAAAGAARRVRRGPKPMLLAALGMLVLAAFGVSAVVLGLVPDPFAEPAAPVVRRPAQPANVGSTPAEVVPVAAAAAAPVAAEPVSPAAAVVAKVAPEPVKVSSQADPAPRATEKQAEPAKQAAASVGEPAADEASDRDTGGARLVALARKALAEENASGAENLARRALALDANDHHAMEVLARALIDQDRGPEAVTFARRVVDKRKKRVAYRLLLGDALLMVGDETGARREWQEAAKLEPNNREVKLRLR